jgi:hypothetical protein
MYPERKPKDKPWNGAYGDDDDEDTSPFSEPPPPKDPPWNGAYGDDDD